GRVIGEQGVQFKVMSEFRLLHQEGRLYRRPVFPGHSPIKRDVKNVAKIEFDRSQHGGVDETKLACIRLGLSIPNERDDFVYNFFVQDAAGLPEKETNVGPEINIRR